MIIGSDKFSSFMFPEKKEKLLKLLKPQFSVLYKTVCRFAIKMTKSTNVLKSYGYNKKLCLFVACSMLNLLKF